ncbi:MAG: aspartate--tRNA ligase [Thermodesulfobacteriota bacterium]|nr:aspartate--tRNA ligase [Thermodesulfobacteriota bacterium]
MDFHERIYCNSLNAEQTGTRVILAGWVDALRDHGEILFIHLRDRSGIIQVVFDPAKTDPQVYKQAVSLRSEYCIQVAGTIIQRSAGTENPNIETGQIEVVADQMKILSTADSLPFHISEKSMVAGTDVHNRETINEDLRLQYRFLDLRRPSMQAKLFKRHKIMRCIRNFLDEKGFIEVETPMLTRSTPEGARDYLVPSRHYPGSFYALPQSPQLFKQLLMVSGFEKYYQIVRCFRDEDLRPNRQPEFSQLDLEASFIDEEFIYSLFEELVGKIFAVNNISLPEKFPRMTWHEAMESTGTDRPDLRFDMTFIDATDLFTHTDYSIFKQIIDRGGCIKGINIKGQSDRLSKNILQNEYAKVIVPEFGARGMTWMRVTSGCLESNIVQFFSEKEQKDIMERFKTRDGDVLMIIADVSWQTVCSALGQLRLHVADRLKLIPQDVYKPVWVTEFPLFEASSDGLTSTHHPFTMPSSREFDPKQTEECLALSSLSYDLVMNGEELGGGSIRINDQTLQQKIFQALGLSREEVDQKFGFFLRGLSYGTPPHGGIALGIDRVVSIILGTSSIREVIAFPKNRRAFCPLTGAPSDVAKSQLSELGLTGEETKPSLPGAESQDDPVDRLSWVSRIAVDSHENDIIRQAVTAAEELAEFITDRTRTMGDHEPVYSVVPLKNLTRKGISARRHALSENRDLLKNAPAVKGGYFKVASILE